MHGTNAAHKGNKSIFLHGNFKRYFCDYSCAIRLRNLLPRRKKGKEGKGMGEGDEGRILAEVRDRGREWKGKARKGMERQDSIKAGREGKTK